jgi:predicted nucleic acid-binding protein
MRVLLDTNVVLDVLLSREPWLDDAKALWLATDNGQLTAYLSAANLTDIYYVARRLADAALARQAIKLCLDAFEILPVDRAALERAQQLSGPDFEDNLQIASAEAADLDAIVTRDAAGFTDSTVAVLSPRECRLLLADSSDRR